MSANGQLRPDELTAIQGQYLANATANAFNTMSEASWITNRVRLRISAGGAYRNLADQQYLIDHPEGPVPIARLGYSSHGDGRAVDISNWSSVYGWLVANAPRFGFRQQFASERWHWRHDGATAAGSGGSLIIELEMESEMYVKGVTNPEIYCVWTAPNGTPQIRLCGKNEAAAAAGRAVVCDNTTLSNLGIECNYRGVIPAVPGAGGGSGGGASKADVDAAADRVIAKIPTKAILS
jgi:hypothetical protein